MEAQSVFSLDNDCSSTSPVPVGRARAQMTVTLFGDDTAVLKQKATEMAGVLREVAGAWRCRRATT
jgi:hypothetical protein